MLKKKMILLFTPIALAGLLLNIIPLLLDALLGHHMPYGLGYGVIIVQIAIIYGIPWSISAYLNHKNTDERIEKRPSIVRFAKAFICALFTVAACYFFRNAIYCFGYLFWNYTPDPVTSDITYHDLTNPQIYISVISLVIITPLFEELFYRGVLVQHRLKDVFPLLTIVSSSVCFLFGHEMIEQILLIFPFSILAAIFTMAQSLFLWDEQS